MDKKLINEDIQNMKYLFGYKPGRVISEQDIDYTTDDYLDTTEMDEQENPFRNNSDLDSYNFPDELKDRLSNIYDLLDEEMEDPDNDPSDYHDMFDFASVVISGVLIKLRREFGDEFEEYEDDVDDYLRNNEDEYIFDFYNSHSDFDEDDDEFNELDEDMFAGWDEPETFKSTPLTKLNKLDLDDFDDDVDYDVELEDEEDILFEQEEPETDRYMFFSNLEQIHRQTGLLLEKDPQMISSILENGHDWAQDHIATSKESIDQV